LLVMSKQLDKLMRKAVAAVVVSRVQLAEEAEYHPITFAYYMSGKRRVTPGAALALAGVIRKRIEVLTDLAGKLEATADKEDAHG